MRTDLALEFASKLEPQTGITIEKGSIKGVKIQAITLSHDGGKVIGKPSGRYTTLFCSGDSDESEVKAIGDVLTEFVGDARSVLVAGLGNEHITPDALGVRCLGDTIATAHLQELPAFRELSLRAVYAVETGVLAQTGVESSEQLRYLCEGIKPSLIVAIDSLSCSEIDKLGKTVQITDSGIAPGSGVKNARQEISARTMGVPVVAIGVPTVAAIPDEDELMIVPKNVDLVINRFAKIIAKALNHALNPNLTPEEMEMLRF